MRTDLFEVERIGAAEFLRLQQALVSVYRAAFTPPPYEKREGSVRQFGNVLDKHAARDEFRAVVARRMDRDPFRDGTAIVGFAYGYRSGKGQWWHDKVAAALGREKAAYWLSDAFEFVELAVRPAQQGLGLGGKLHDALLHGVKNRTAVLSTLDAETAGFHLYRKRNWQVLISDYNFPNVSRPYMIMGREL
jgi:ribosomal protein S18 acetylase RimI-like enzyme